MGNERRATLQASKKAIQEQFLREQAAAEAAQKLKEAEIEASKAAVFNAKSQGYDRFAAKNRRSFRTMKRSKFLVAV